MNLVCIVYVSLQIYALVILYVSWELVRQAGLVCSSTFDVVMTRLKCNNITNSWCPPPMLDFFFNL